jgi:hypothetical protein
MPQPLAPRVTARTRGERATLTARCDTGIHKVTLTITGDITTEHDVDVDAVTSALGGPLHPCGQGIASFHAAHAILDAVTGTHDLPGLKWTARKGWSDGHACATCRNYESGLSHLLSPGHQASRTDGDTHVTRILYGWLTRYDTRLATPPDRLNPAIKAALNQIDPTASDLFIHADRVLHPEYITAAARIVGPHATAIIALRDSGVTVDWIRALARRTRVSAARHAQTTNTTLPRTLIASRNVNPTIVADYLNAGITAHFHTYARVNATPADILAIYRNANGRTLADLLAEGMTIPDALRRYAA